MEFVRDSSLIKLKHNKLMEEGFDRIHIPGGTSKDGSHYSGVVISEYDRLTKNVYFVGVPYNSNFHKEDKDEEGSHTKKTGESPIDTAIREVIEETGLTILPQDLQRLSASFTVNDKRDVSKTHSKNFYTPSKFSGNLFSFEGPNPIDAETAAPLFIPAEMFTQVVFKGHLAAVMEVIRKLRHQNEFYGYALMNIR